MNVSDLLHLIRDLTTDDECVYDHHGYCQTHYLGSRPCAHERARELLSEFGLRP